MAPGSGNEKYIEIPVSLNQLFPATNQLYKTAYIKINIRVLIHKYVNKNIGTQKISKNVTIYRKKFFR